MTQTQTYRHARGAPAVPARNLRAFPARNLRAFRGGVWLGPSPLPPRDPVTNAALPGVAVISMRQHAGEPAECAVRAGDVVREGALVGRARGPGSVPVHASIPGRVVAVEDAPDAAGGSSPAVVVALEGELERSGRARQARRWDGMEPGQLLAAVRAAGIVDSGRFSFPVHTRLERGSGGPPALLVAGAVRDEPWAARIPALLAGRTREIVEGIRIAARLLGPARAVLAVADVDRGCVPAFERAIDASGGGIEIAVVSSRYPQADEEILAAVLGHPGGAVVLGAAALLAVQEAVALDRPQLEAVVSVGGSIVRSPRTLKARIGTRVADLLEECGGCTEEPGGIVLGSLMTGRMAPAGATLTRDVTAVVALGSREARFPRALACIRCGACIDACPWGLDPGSLCKLLEHGQAAEARSRGLDSCSLCGCCAHVCPSRIPLAGLLAQGRRGGCSA